jgi:hypothetical protein
MSYVNQTERITNYPQRLLMLGDISSVWVGKSGGASTERSSRITFEDAYGWIELLTGRSLSHEVRVGAPVLSRCTAAPVNDVETATLTFCESFSRVFCGGIEPFDAEPGGSTESTCQTLETHADFEHETH